MRWEDKRQSDNVEDRRGQAMRRGGIGFGTILVALVGGWLLGVNPLEILGLIGGVDGGSVVQAPAPSSPGPHGVYWFRIGTDSRQLSDCDTFARADP